MKYDAFEKGVEFANLFLKKQKLERELRHINQDLIFQFKLFSSEYLSPREKKIFHMVIVKNMKKKDIAQKIETTTERVNSIIKSVLKNLPIPKKVIPQEKRKVMTDLHYGCGIKKCLYVKEH
jgi:DNA-directed RNA polymerase specialized sigma subunit